MTKNTPTISSQTALRGYDNEFINLTLISGRRSHKEAPDQKEFTDSGPQTAAYFDIR
jgi:hypothetical protein